MSTFKPKSERIAVGVAPVRVSSTSKRVLGLTVQADSANSGDIFVGGSEVNVSGDDKGIRLDAGEKISLDDLFMGRGVNEWELSEVYLRSADTDQFAIVVYPDLHKA